MLENDYGLDLTGWELRSASGVSADGTIVVGEGMGPNGADAWVARIPPEGGTCPGELDCDGDIDLSDLALLLASYGRDAGGDLDSDSLTGLSDLSLLLSVYGTTCE